MFSVTKRAFNENVKFLYSEYCMIILNPWEKFNGQILYSVSVFDSVHSG